MEDRRILVFYIGIGNMHENDIPNYIDSVKVRFFDPEFIKRNNCEIFMIPTRDMNSKIECINPIYITDEKLIAEHEEMMKTLNDSLYHLTAEKK